MSEKVILPSDEVFTYSGRIDFENIDAPTFVFACSNFRFVTDAKAGKIKVENIRSYAENALGVLVDGNDRGKLVLPDEGVKKIDISAFLDGMEHEITIFKRQDSCHYFVFHGLLVDEDAMVKKAAPAPKRRMEVYGDSVSCGEVSEATAYVGMADPEHNGEYSNSFYSYSWLCARKLNAELHDTSQGGIALLDKTGYFAGPDCVGMESCYDKIKYNPQLGSLSEWDFSKYIPHVVVVAIGQNDANPENYMAENYDGEKACHWRAEYKKFILKLREKYPKAQIILLTTILNHDAGWDKAIEEVTNTLREQDANIHHFLFENNGCGTHGHIRIPEAVKMADELSAFIDSLGKGIWED